MATLKGKIEHKLMKNLVKYREDTSDLTHLLLCYYTHYVFEDKKEKRYEIQEGCELNFNEKDFSPYLKDYRSDVNNKLAEWRVAHVYRNMSKEEKKKQKEKEKKELKEKKKQKEKEEKLK